MQTSALKKLNVALISGAVTLFAAAPAAQAAVVTNLLATPISITNSIDGVYLNVVTGAFGASAAAATGWDINPYNNNAGLTFYGTATPYGILATGTAGTGAVATSLAIGATISSAGQFNQFQTLGTAFQATTGTQYVGFKFLNESTGAADYGYLALTTTSGTGFPATILGWAYENTGASITVASLTAAAVPEADNVAMLGLGLGLVGVTLAKRRKQA